MSGASFVWLVVLPGSDPEPSPSPSESPSQSVEPTPSPSASASPDSGSQQPSATASETVESAWTPEAVATALESLQIMTFCLALVMVASLARLFRR